MMKMRTPRHALHAVDRQRGATLLVAMIMLVLITMMVITSMNLGKSSLQTVGNMQQRNQANAAAHEVIEEVISKTALFDTPANILANPCNGTPNTKCIDVNGDGTPDITVTLTPQPSCVKTVGVKNSQLQLVANADGTMGEDANCSVSADNNKWAMGADPTAAATTAGNSLCYNTVWDVRAEAKDLVTQATVVATQGIAVRMNEDQIVAGCP